MKVLGKKPSGDMFTRISKSPNFKDGGFKNLSHTSMMGEGVTMMDMMKDFFNRPADRVPKKIVPSVKTDLNNITSGKPVITWFGHSSYHLSIDGKSVLVDPVMSGAASPFSFAIKAFPGTDIYSPGDFNHIDLLLLTHDHYDHLDYKTVIRLRDKVDKVCCSLGVAAHLVYWGFDKTKITELDWWESAVFDKLKITAAPARHFSGRTFTRAQSLWSAFVLEVQGYRLFLGGDSGYDTHFVEIGKRFDGFDFALLECGQYNYKWPFIHMMPEEMVQAAIDIGAKVTMPVHWGKFALAFHDWYEPVTRAHKSAMERGVKLASPKIGQSLVVGEAFVNEEWWNS